MAQMYDIFLTVLAYSIIIFGSLFFYNFLSKGYLITFLRVKASRGKKVMVRAWSTIGRSFVIGTIQDGLLQFIPRGHKKDDKSSLAVSRKDVHDEMGVKMVDVDLENHKVITLGGEDHEGHYVDQFDFLLQKALNKPNLVDKTRENIMLIASILALVGTAVCIFMLFNLTKTVSTLGSVGVIN